MVLGGNAVTNLENVTEAGIWPGPFVIRIDPGVSSHWTIQDTYPARSSRWIEVRINKSRQVIAETEEIAH